MIHFILKILEFTQIRKVTDMRNITMPAGTYYIGDPCYMVKDNASGNNFWDRLCELTYKPRAQLKSMIVDSMLIWSHATIHGDGLFLLQTKNFQSRLYVDSGRIACMKISDSLIPYKLNDDRFHDVDDKSSHYCIRSFTNEFEVGYSLGQFYIGNYTINTKWR